MSINLLNLDNDKNSFNVSRNLKYKNKLNDSLVIYTF